MTTMGCLSRIGFMMAAALLSIPLSRWLHLSTIPAGILLVLAFFLPFVSELAVLFSCDVICGSKQVREQDRQEEHSDR
ncbi:MULTISPECIES: hypothetical protein [Pirellulaceae]|nr:MULTISPECIES: hypothetical protein [Pirellulaceae]